MHYALQLDWLHMLPHGLCLLWEPWLVWLTVAGHALTAIAFAVIPASLFVIARMRPDLPYAYMYWWFGAFTTLCGLTHVFAVVTIWYPAYWTAAGLGLLTGVVSAAAGVKYLALVGSMLAVVPTGQDLTALRGRIDQETRRLDDETARAGIETPVPPEALTLTKDLLRDIDALIAKAESLLT